MPGCVLHSLAIGRVLGILNMSCDPAAASTGAQIQLGANEMSRTAQAVQVTALDFVLSGIGPDDCVLLKLDLQACELEALLGAAVSLASLEVILMKVGFYAQPYEPPLTTLMAFLANLGLCAA